MSRMLFINGGAHGHINPTLSLVKELVERGEEAFYLSTDEFKNRISATGAEYLDGDGKLAEFYRNYKPSGRHPFYNLIDFILKSDQTLVHVIQDITKKINVDYFVHDSIFGGGKIVKNFLKVPSICSCTSFAMSKLPMPPHMFEPGFHPELDTLYSNIDNAAKEWGISNLSIMDLFFKKGELSIVFTSKEFQPDIDKFDESFKFIGPSISQREEEIDFPLDELNDCKVVYISMGTINNDNIEFYNKCLRAFDGENLKVVMSVGNRIDKESLRNIPENVMVYNYVPQLEILKKTHVFITHGGLNSVNEAMWYGVPMISIPQANDQYMVTRQIESAGAGISLKMAEVTAQDLKNAVKTLINDEKYKKESKRIGDTFRKAGGYKKAADYIMEFVGSPQK